MKWIPIYDDQRPENGQCVLVSFSNYPVPALAEYRSKGDGSYFWAADGTYIKFSDIGLYVNAWMPLPDPYWEEAL